MQRFLFEANQKSMKTNKIAERILFLETTALIRGVGELKKESISRAGEQDWRPEKKFKNINSKEEKRPPSILIIDNDDNLRVKLKDHLIRKGFIVKDCAGEKEDQRSSLIERFDLYIIEALLPEAGGVEKVVSIKQEFPFAPIICMSKGGLYGTDIDFDIATKMGALTLEKPFKFTKIEKLINYALSKKEPN